MKVINDKKIHDVKVIEFDIHKDERGQFSRLFCQKEFESAGVLKPIVQMNHSFTKDKGSVRGMHYQLPPKMESKYVRCLSGEIFDVVIDLRKESDTYLQWTGIHLNSNEGKMICIPQGFAHGFQTLTEDVELFYMHTEFYEPNIERGIHHLDSSLKIDWPIDITIVSDRDKNLSFLDESFKGIEI